MDSSHLLLFITIQNKNNSFFGFKKRTGLQSGNSGVSASKKGFPHCFSPFLSLAPLIFTSSAFLSPDPSNQQLNMSPFGNSTIELL